MNRDQLVNTRQSSVRVETLSLTASQAYLIHSPRPLLVDVGLERDQPRVLRALDRHGLSPHDLGAIILTHAHADHAGAIAGIATRSGAPVIAGASDLGVIRAGGESGSAPVTSLRRLLGRFGLVQSYPPLPPEARVVSVSEELSLSAFGAHGRIMPVPGHTSGSIAVVLETGDAFAGDMVIGGYALGRINRTRPVDHFIHSNRAWNHASLALLLATQAHTWYLGHGGPVSATSVRAWLHGLAKTDQQARHILKVSPKFRE